jgi:hypothetical protein
MAPLTQVRQDRGATVTRFSSDFDEIFPPAEVREQAELRRKRNERWYDLIVGAAILGALLAFLYFFASAALAASTVIVNPGTLTQANLDAAGVNGTLRLITGQYQCATQLKPLAGQSFIGSGKIGAVPYLDTATVPGFSIPSFKLTYIGPEIVAPAGFYAFKISAAGVTFQNVAFRDNAIWLEGTAAQTKGLKIDQCWFSAFAPMGGEYNNAIYLNHSQDVRITDSAFNDAGNKFDHFVFGYSAANFYAAWCSFDGAGDGIHIADFGGATTGSVEESLFTHQKRMAVEYQGGGRGFTVKNCWQQESIFLADPRPHATPGNPNDNNLGYSLPSDASTGTTATGNVTIGPPAQLQGGVMHKQYFGYEFSGQDWRCNGNLIVNVEWPIAVTNSNAWGTATNNHIEQCGGYDVSTPAVKNGLLSRGKPGPMHRLGQPTAPATQPTFAAAMIVTGDTTADLYWPAQQGATSYTIQTKTSQGVDDWKTLGSVTDSPAKIVGFHGGWEYDARVIAGNQTSTAARKRIGDISLSTQPFPNNPALAGTVTPEPPPTTQFVDDPVVKVETTVTQKSGKQTRTTAAP